MLKQKVMLIALILVVGLAGYGRAELIAYWTFDEGEGNVAYDEIGGYDAQITNPVWLLPGQTGNAAIEVAGGDEINAGPGPTPTTEDLTLAWWMIDNHANYGTIMDKAPSEGTRGYNILVRDESTEGSPLRFRIGSFSTYGGWGTECMLPEGAYNDGEWVHITCTYDSATDTATIYVNGELLENGANNPKTGIAGDGGYCDGVNNPDEPLYIHGGAETFNGVMDEVAIWDHALTPGEVLSVYESGVLPLGAIDPVPGYGETVKIDENLELSWDLLAGPDSNDVYVDVWYGTEPNELHPGYDMTKVLVAGENAASVIVDASLVDTYYWQINSYISGPDKIDDANMLEGILLHFYAVADAAPTVVIETLDQMTWSGEGVPLDSTVTDDASSALTIEWSADLPGGVSVAYDPGNDVADTTVTLTKALYGAALITNPGFEADQGEDGYWGAATGWAGGGNWNPGDEPAPAGYEGLGDGYTGSAVPEGNMCGWTSDALSQVLAETLAADTQYELTVQVGNSKTYEWTGYNVQLLAGGTVLAEDVDTVEVPFDSWALVTVQFDSAGVDPELVGQPLEIRLRSMQLHTADYSELNFDDVRLTADPGFIPTGVQTVTMTVTVGDVTTPTSDTASIEIDVYDDACHVARAGLGRSAITDFDENCITGIEELVVMVMAWLDDYSSTGPIDRP